MRMSDGVEWGLHCALVLACLEEGATMSAKDLAELHGISPSYLLKHLQAMTSAGLLESVSGPQGGYRLAKEPVDVSLLEVVEAIDGPVRPFRCTEIRRRGPLAGDDAEIRLPCAIHATMQEIECEYRESLRSRTLADVMELYWHRVPPQKIESAAAWARQRSRHPRLEKEKQ